MNATVGRAVYKSVERPDRVGRRVPLLREMIAKNVKTRGGEGRDLTLRTLYLPVMIAATVTVTCAAALLAGSEEAEAIFPGKNGRIAYSVFGESTDDTIYTIDPGGGAKAKLTNGSGPSWGSRP